MSSLIRNFILIVLIYLSCTTLDVIGENCRQRQNDCEEESSYLATGAKVVGGVAVGLGAVAAAPVALAAAGFTTAGVLAGSAAAGIQSVVYGASATGVFSVAQSVGATGVAATTKIIVGGIGGILAYFW